MEQPVDADLIGVPDSGTTAAVAILKLQAYLLVRTGKNPLWEEPLSIPTLI